MPSNKNPAKKYEKNSAILDSIGMRAMVTKENANDMGSNHMI